MAKKQIKREPMPQEVQDRMEKFVKAKESEQKGKRTIISILGASLFCFIVLLIVLLKINGVGKTIVFDHSAANANASVRVEDSEDVSGTRLADIIADNITESNTADEEITSTTDSQN